MPGTQGRHLSSILHRSFALEKHRRNQVSKQRISCTNGCLPADTVKGEQVLVVPETERRNFSPELHRDFTLQLIKWRA